jgi:hypothetical protein
MSHDRAVRRLILMLCVVAAALCLAGATSDAGAADGLPSRLAAGQRWSTDAIAGSPSGRFEFVLFNDGGMSLDEIVHLASDPPGAVGEFHAWSGLLEDVNRNCAHGYLSMQTNGNLVRYCRAGEPLWSTHTAGTGSHNYFQIQDNGNLVVYTSSGRRVWAAGSAAPLVTTGQQLGPGQRIRSQDWNHPFVSLTMQRGGDLVLTYGPRVAWRSGTHTPGSRLMLLRGGNLAVEGPHGHTLWSTHTAGIGAGATLCVLDDGTIAEARLIGPHGKTRWSRSG